MVVLVGGRLYAKTHGGGGGAASAAATIGQDTAGPTDGDPINCYKS